MGYPEMTFTLHLPCAAIALMCVLFCHISFGSATSLRQNEVPRFDHLSKRDVGLKMHCQTHPRNCPGGYLLKRSRLVEKLLDREPLQRMGDDDDADQTKMDALSVDDDLRRNVYDLRKELRSRLLDLLQSSSAESSEETKEDW